MDEITHTPSRSVIQRVDRKELPPDVLLSMLRRNLRQREADSIAVERKAEEKLQA